MNPRLRLLLENLLAPLTLAGYVAWAVVWIGSADDFARLGDVGERLAQAGMLGFLAGFVACVSGELEHRPGQQRVLHGVLALLALALVAYGRNGVTPILIVLLAALLASHLRGWALPAALLLINAALLAIMAGVWGMRGGNLWVTLLAHGSFQAFAALLMRSARRAEEMAEQLRATNAELLTTRTLLAESARDQERLRLSRELHDVAGHGLTALKLNLGVLARDPQQHDHPRIALCAQLADELLQNLRSVVQQMRHEPGIDLGAALQRLGLPFPRPRLQLDLAEQPALVDRDQIEAVLRAVQEGLTNAARHGPARELKVSLAAQGDDWALRIEDDGRAPADVAAGGGLSGMRERFEQLGGALSIGRSSSGGLRLDARWPRGVAA